MSRRDAQIVRALRGWYRTAARDLPWRRTRDPYAIWVSEVMLQQTRVDTVIPYFERFLQRYPDIPSLAAAPLDDVLSLWSGLGYYSRARQLHTAAREVVERHGGRLPRDAATLRTLRGIGAYTAGAIASIAFGQREPLVDGNVSRVLARVLGIEEDVRSPAGLRLVWARAAELVPEEAPGELNQALMELGATLCSPRAPACPQCPLQSDCVARRTGREQDLPVASIRRKIKAVTMVAAVVWHGREVWLARRSEGGLFGGLWEPPMVEAASMEEARALLGGCGVDIGRVPLQPAGQVRHVLTHRTMDVLVACGEAPSRWRPKKPTTLPYERTAWFDPEDARVGISTLARKVLAKSQGSSRRPRRITRSPSSPSEGSA